MGVANMGAGLPNKADVGLICGTIIAKSAIPVIRPTAIMRRVCDPVMAATDELPVGICNMGGNRTYSIRIILKTVSPPGAFTLTVAFKRLPMSAWPSGDS